jgi:NADH/F420H2 dehydrogenase subunit C
LSFKIEFRGETPSLSGAKRNLARDWWSKMDIRTKVPTIYGAWSEKFGPTWTDHEAKVREKFGADLLSVLMPGTDPTDVPIFIFSCSKNIEVAEFFKTSLGYQFLSDYTATDEELDPRFFLVLQLMSLETKCRVRVKFQVSEGVDVQSLVPVWPGASWAEREIYDMFGISFLNHPDLRRILLDIRWEGHPLRKDYPLRGYQSFTTPEEIDPELLK